MFRWPQNGGSLSTVSSELSGEEGFLPTTAANSKHENRSFQVSFDDSHKAFRT